MVFEETITRLSELARNLPQDQCGVPLTTDPTSAQNFTDALDPDQAAVDAMFGNETDDAGVTRFNSKLWQFKA